MIVTYFRSSALNTWRMCNQQYYIQYVLGGSQPANKKADAGTILHKCCEILAVAKLAQQQGKSVFADDILGEDVPVEIMHDTDWIYEKVYEYYTQLMTGHVWEEEDRKQIHKWLNKCLAYGDGALDPRKLNVVSPEMRFDFEIKKEWAKYSYELKGEKLEGYLALKGTIDLLIEPEPGVLELVDWKTGRRYDWATDEVKDYKKLREDIQLRMYHYAIHHMFPNAENFIATIFFMNDGGAYSIPFNKKDLIETEGRLREYFETIRDTEVPELSINKKWKCKKFCHFGKTMMPSGKYSICEFVHRQIKQTGIDHVTGKHKNPDFTIGHYKAPGEVE